MSELKSLNTSLQTIAGNGLLHRRIFLTQGAALLSAASLGLLSPARVKAQAPLDLPPLAKIPGAAMSGYGNRSEYEEGIQRNHIISRPGTTGSGGSWTPLESLEGIMPTSGPACDSEHSGIRKLYPEAHRLLLR